MDKIYKIIDEREPIGSSERVSEPMTLKQVKKYLGKEFECCEDVFDINEKLDDEKCGEAGYKVIRAWEDLV